MRTAETVLIVLSRVAAILVGATTAYVAVAAWRGGAPPEGWPWSVLTLIGLAVMMATVPRAADRQYPVARALLSLVVIVCSALWYLSD
jgi:hypothetical protein